jgi:MarR family 2-MHQ and catechol resistance regulon transcriptional repressor
MQDTSGIHVWLVQALAAHAHDSLGLSQTGLCDSDFRVLEALLHKGPLPVNTVGSKGMAHAGMVTVDVDRLEKKGLVNGKIPAPARAPGGTHGERAALLSPRLSGYTRPQWNRPPAS